MRVESLNIFVSLVNVIVQVFNTLSNWSGKVNKDVPAFDVLKEMLSREYTRLSLLAGGGGFPSLFCGLSSPQLISKQSETAINRFFIMTKIILLKSFVKYFKAKTV